MLPTTSAASKQRPPFEIFGSWSGRFTPPGFLEAKVLLFSESCRADQTFEFVRTIGIIFLLVPPQLNKLLHFEKFVSDIMFFYAALQKLPPY